MNKNWERHSQVEKIMKNNKPIKLTEYKKQSFWESCVQEYFERDKRRWMNKK